MPPTPEDVQAFVSDNAPDAFAKVVDRLLASPQYGERWGRHWLDLARYADTNGFKTDEPRPNIWRYRDYVIQAFNEDKPYDRFIREQIAGDELYPNDLNARIAVGFNRHFTDETNQPVIELRRQETLNDITDTVGAVFMGMTYGCARCHDHKFDPILHKDYYRLQAFFANIREQDDLVLLTGPGTGDVQAATRRVGRSDSRHPRRDARDGGADGEGPARLLHHPLFRWHQGGTEDAARTAQSAAGAAGHQGDAADHLRRSRAGQLQG